MKAAIRDNDPVFVMENTLLYGEKWEVPEEEYILPIGVADIKREGTDVTIVACGHLVWKSIEAAKQLEAEGISVEVINLHTIKPFDEAAIINSLKKTGCVVTAEEHNVIGGMGDVVAQAAAKHYPVPVEYIGTQDTFGESGTPNQLLTKYGLDAVNIVAAAKKVISRKA